LLQAQNNLLIASQKIDLLRLALETKQGEIRSDVQKARELKHELDQTATGSVSSPFPSHGNTLGLSGSSFSSLNKCAAVTGKLEVRLMGCQDLLEEVPGRSKSKEAGSPADIRAFVKGVTGRSSSKSYNVKDETTSKNLQVFF